MVLSVVVPVHDVATHYLTAALDSILASGAPLREVVVVDDGSTGEVPAVLASYAAAHPDLVRVLRIPNSGAGTARNLGVREARGRYLTFVDADDLVVPGIHAAMVGGLEESGSDFAVCHFERLAPDGTRSSLRWAERVHAERRVAARVDDVPEILGDVFCWDKVFRTDVWRDHGLAFPEGTRYQDQPVVTEAFLRARAFDVHPDVGYLWRVRADGSSAMQGRDRLDNLRDRAATKVSTWELGRRLGSPAARAVLHDRVLPGDLHHYFAVVPRAEDDYWLELRRMVLELWGPGRSLADTELLPAHRVMGWLVEQDRRADAVAWWERAREARSLEVRPTADGTGLALRTEEVLATPVPDEVARLRLAEIGWTAVVDEVRRGWRRTRISGTVGVARLGTSHPFRLEVRSLDLPGLTVTAETGHGPVSLTGPVTFADDQRGKAEFHSRL